MTFTSVVQANSKTAEFARLFDLFDRIATRRTRAITGDTSNVISADDIANVPAEFAPVLKNLSTVLSLRARRAPAASTTKPRHNPTLASTPSMTFKAKNPTPRADAVEPSGDVEEYTETPTFPLGERYPFTFKLMLHKLYDLDEWAEKVKDAVETSKSQFKPLTERVQNVVRDATTSANIKERGEKRSCAISALGTSAKFKPPSTTRRPDSPEVTRALKKRCIRRRKSVNGPISTGVWVYDAAISATDVTGPRTEATVEITLFADRDAGGVVENRVRHRSLTALEEMQTRDTARRKVKITVPLLQEEATETVPPQLSSSSVSQQVIETESVVKRRRSVASVFASGSCKRVAVKRPLCV
ncbi:hypothetical protein OG21DRAFT_1415590 [Imleria badia]|nr:hypothetical protein OG21DRAFT_1415590 [Imleria badia]